MRSTIARHIIWVAAAVCGCLDLGLLDDMDPMDSGSAAEGTSDADADADGDADADADTDSDGDGPPATDSADTDPPALVSLSCGAGEDDSGGICVAVGPVSASLRLATDEPASVALEVGDAGVSGGVLSAAWSYEHHLGLTGLPPGVPLEAAISLVDVNENHDSVAVSVTATGGDAVAITEVLADPAGAEPDQELVEIANLGSVALDLSGWMIDDNGDLNGDLLPDGAILEPGQVAILVGPNFDPSATEDPAPDPAALIIYLSSSIGSNGLKNSEVEPVELYDGNSGLVSRYAGQMGDPVEGRSAYRIAAELPDGDEMAWELSPAGGATPGTVPTLP
jgi:hypothetical protein